jgi:hypothetical protein
MILLNFSHPFTTAQLADIERLSGQRIDRVFDLPVQFDHQQPFLPQLQALMEKLDLPPAKLQTEAVLVNLPALNFIAGLALAELHGRMGYFPPVIRLRPVENSLPPRYEVAEILNLQAARDAARPSRYR